MKYLFRYVLLSVLFIAGMIFIFTPIKNIGIEQPYIEAVSNGHVFDEQELEDFLYIWRKAVSGYAKNYMPSSSLDEMSRPSGVFLRWLKLHNWNAQRFFYDEQRLRNLAECVEVKSSLDSNETMQKEGGAQLDNLMDLQKQQLSVCKYDKDELELITTNISKIRKLIADAYLPGAEK